MPADLPATPPQLFQILHTILWATTNHSVGMTGSCYLQGTISCHSGCGAISPHPSPPSHRVWHRALHTGGVSLCAQAQGFSIASHTSQREATLGGNRRLALQLPTKLRTILLSRWDPPTPALAILQGQQELRPTTSCT